LLLLPARGHHPLADLGRGLAGALGGDLAGLHGRHFDVQIDAIEQRAGNPPEIILDFAWRTAPLARDPAIRRARRCLFVSGL
jgi:hypothetical protein